ncbi:MAG TPA: IS200/IS605 family transposase [Patescibacteria group bacterium]|nr:IS200/IS605 family transposase [Patescibacteria group bacterium]
MDNTVDLLIKKVCLDIAKRYELHFIEIGTNQDHIHFLIQSIPTWTIARIVTIIKSITARQVFATIPTLKKELWGASLWTSGYYASTVGKHGNETVITRYVKQQRRKEEYVQIHKDQLRLW